MALSPHGHAHRCLSRVFACVAPAPRPQPGRARWTTQPAGRRASGAPSLPRHDPTARRHDLALVCRDLACRAPSARAGACGLRRPRRWQPAGRSRRAGRPQPSPGPPGAALRRELGRAGLLLQA
eukprot:scaffold9208_cov98-Isochrysis_galbana.AAC.16